MRKEQIAAKGKQFVKHVVPAVIKPVHSLWHQVIGFLFLVLAVWATPTAIRAIRDLHGEEGSMGKVVLALLFILIMAGYGVSSLLRARRISRS